MRWTIETVAGNKFFVVNDRKCIVTDTLPQSLRQTWEEIVAKANKGFDFAEKQDTQCQLSMKL